MSAQAPLLVVDRASGALVEERVFGATALRRIYGAGLVSAVLRRLLPRPSFSALYGRLQRLPCSRAKIAGFVEGLGIDVTEAAEPLHSYRTLDAFFGRRLRDGARPIDASPAVLCSPADGRALAYADVTGDLPVKGCAVSVPGLLAAVPPFARATVLVVRLAPADYHRFHAPCAGLLSGPRRVGAALHSVHPIALAAGAPSFNNLRHVSRLDDTAFGSILLVEVGALLVGEIERTRAPGPVEKGDELGVFHFGGSTVVMVADAARVAFDDDLLANTARGLETLVRVGTRVGARIDAHGAPPMREVPR